MVAASVIVKAETFLQIVRSLPINVRDKQDVIPSWVFTSLNISLSALWKPKSDEYNNRPKKDAA